MKNIKEITRFLKLSNTQKLFAFSQVGSVVQIPCRVHLIGDEMVSRANWINYSFIIVLRLRFPGFDGKIIIC